MLAAAVPLLLVRELVVVIELHRVLAGLLHGDAVRLVRTAARLAGPRTVEANGKLVANLDAAGLLELPFSGVGGDVERPLDAIGLLDGEDLVLAVTTVAGVDAGDRPNKRVAGVGRNPCFGVLPRTAGSRRRRSPRPTRQ